ncbi:hypothetical protein JAAARDRAFT_179362 [Jaapia argillacea MUCL 33604]|uniref:Enoyl reductase (ER) domain-containing protein n=1 Tax=Jaapia argillacea MUCL 33604 TaxID=933084 RepID=A0A067PPK7_9AGAM|nr:hypothetical protein JAAARDRAFT_179362 [Jaapia argillacea MUCL 33604]
MKAARYHGPGDIRVEQVSEPDVAKGQVKIKVRLCGSDLHAFLTVTSIFPTVDEPNFLTKEKLPITLGHEFSGTVVEVGEGVDKNKFPANQSVCAEPLLSCRTASCSECADGSRNICPHANSLGIAGWGGGLSEYISVDQDLVHVLPPNIPLDVGACIEPLSVAWYAVKRSGFKAGDSTLVLGSGPASIIFLQPIRALGASWIGVSEPSPLRRQLASKHGASALFDPLSPGVDILQSILDATSGRGVDIAFDCAGVQAALDTALVSLKPRGVLMGIALWEGKPVLDANLILFRELTYTGIISYDRVHPEVIQAVASGKLGSFEDIITSKIAIEDVVEKGFKALIEEKDRQIKVLVHP